MTAGVECVTQFRRFSNLFPTREAVHREARPTGAASLEIIGRAKLLLSRIPLEVPPNVHTRLAGQSLSVGCDLGR